ncbi:hypothetical protein EsHS_00006723 [Epichloe bromicola]
MAEPYNTPIPGSTPRSGPPVSHLHPLPLRHPHPHANDASTTASKPRILHLGDPIRFNKTTHDLLSLNYDIIRPPTPARQRRAFTQALQNRKWGDFEAIFRPSWHSGGEMGDWHDELIRLLPPSVQVFASAGAGFDGVNTRLLGERGIIYCSGGPACADSVADLAVAMVISTFRHIPWCINAARCNSPSGFTDCHLNAPAQSHSLGGQTLGIIGLGNIGHRVAARCRLGFGMTIHYFDVERKAYAVEAQVGATFHDSLESLLGVADCVVLCAPGPLGGEAIIDASSLRHFRHGGRLVNVARGALVNEDDLVEALETGRLSSVALDVHADEPRVHQGLMGFADQGRAMLTCHNGGGTVEAHAGSEELSMRNVMAVLEGEEPLSAVNLAYLKKKG